MESRRTTRSTANGQSGEGAAGEPVPATAAAPPATADIAALVRAEWMVN